MRGILPNNIDIKKPARMSRLFLPRDTDIRMNMPHLNGTVFDARRWFYCRLGNGANLLI